MLKTSSHKTSKQALPGYVIAYAVFLILSALMLHNFANWPLPGDNVPLLLFQPIFLVAILSPQLLPIWVFFVMGILIDVILGTPLGMTAFLVLLAYFVLSRMRVMLSAASIPVLLVLFIFLCESLRWVMVCILSGEMQNFMPVMNAVLSHVIIFPAVFLALFKAGHMTE